MVISNNTKVVIFDLDGTLKDSMGVWDKMCMDFLTKIEDCIHAVNGAKKDIESVANKYFYNYCELEV